ncbi:hypothetical protein [Arenimonas sp.]|uniref:hypothetical protein n=1 Tax=Arenimonas sp. TaxID=1872635 RepID=UPI002E318DA8|nr:hypothetical protein [Arenimonas sp.]HEX4852759.1 hypothetical protein [Arenimonas sp.]
MNATIIPFPTFTYPTHWTGHDQYLFNHFKHCDGLSTEEARQRVEEHIYVAREVPGEDEGTRLLRMAREAMARLKKER